MRRSINGSMVMIAMILAIAASLAAAPAKLTVAVNKPGHAISPMLYGIFFEDINCSADGGIYAEMVRNRNFEDSDKPDHWSVLAGGQATVEMSIDSAHPVSPKNPHSLKVRVANPGSSRAGIVNNGFWGIAVGKGQSCELTLFARGGDGFTGPLVASLESSNGVVYAQKTIPSLTADWQGYRPSLTANASDPKARLVISTSRAGTFWLDMVSLFPKQTWKNRPNGFRRAP